MGGNGFSTIQSLDELTKAGFTDEQARAVLRTISQDSASRADLEHATAELKRDIKQLDAKIEVVRSELKRDIAELGSNLTFRMVCVVGVAVGFLGTMMAVFRFLDQ